MTKAFILFCTCLLPVALSAQSRYSNKRYGVSLQYPRSYTLKQGKLGEEDSLGYLGPIPMEFVAPGGLRVVTVEVPPSLYPNTDLGTAFVTVSVNRYLTQKECEQFPEGLGGIRKAAAVKISHLEFHGLDQGEAAVGHQFGGAYYHAFSEGWCYELGEGLSTAGYGAVDGLGKVDDRKIFAILDRILRSITIHPSKAFGTVTASPLIQALAIVRPHDGSPSYAYRLSWDVKGTEAKDVWLLPGCSDSVAIFEIAPAVPDGHGVPCSVARPAASLYGSIDLEFRNLSGKELTESVRLFAAGNPSVARDLTVDVPPSPVIIALTDSFGDIAPMAKPVRVLAGEQIKIDGVAFLPHQTLWIGSTSLPVESTDNRHIAVTVPKSLQAGRYPLFLENENGRGNTVTVQVLP